MRFLKKINRGLILSLVILICLGVYIAANESRRSVDEKEITSLCEDFFAELSPLFTGDADDTEATLEKYYTDDEKSVKSAAEAIDDAVYDRIDTDLEIESLRCDISDISVNFSGDSAEVCIDSNISYTSKGNSGSFSDTCTISVTETADGWRIDYTKLVFELPDNIDNGGSYRYDTADGFINF